MSVCYFKLHYSRYQGLLFRYYVDGHVRIRQFFCMDMPMGSPGNWDDFQPSISNDHNGSVAWSWPAPLWVHPLGCAVLTYSRGSIRLESARDSSELVLRSKSHSRLPGTMGTANGLLRTYVQGKFLEDVHSARLFANGLLMRISCWLWPYRGRVACGLKSESCALQLGGPYPLIVVEVI